MESLLCDEVWVMSPPTTFEHRHEHKKQCIAADEGYTNTWSSFYLTKEDCEQAFVTCLQKELNYMPPTPYLDLLQANHFISFARSKAIHCFTQWRRRFNLSFEAVFNAVNYLDRFIYVNQCHGWKYWMVELVSIASLSIACKFGETEPPSLHEIQDGLEYSYEPRMIQRMELNILKELGWKLNCTTPYSYVELITWELNSLINQPLLLQELITRLTDLLLTSILDYKLLAFRPSIIAVSGLRCILEEKLPSICDAHLAHITTFIPQDQLCDKMMEETLVGRLGKIEANGRSSRYPSSPVTVLTKEQVDIDNRQVDFSHFKMPTDLNINLKLSNKRKRQEQKETNAWI